MSIVYAQSFYLETITGVHDFSTDVFNIALFDNNSSFDGTTTTYSTTNELPVGAGYVAGGKVLSLVATYPKIESGGAAVRWQNISWFFSSIKSNITWAQIYNVSKANRVVMSIQIGAPRNHFGTFNFNFPLSVNPPVWQKGPN